MAYNPNRHHRRSIRLKGYDYTQAGAYFVTVCTRDRVCLFGEVMAGEMSLNGYGERVAQWWHDIPRHFPHADIDAFVVMPNHVHGIVIIDDPVGAGSPRPYIHPDPCNPLGVDGRPWAMETTPLRWGHRRPTLGQVVAYFKIQSAKQINASRQTPVAPVWQRNYYEHVIRNEESLNRVRRYILDNPERWAFDRENPQATAPEREEAWRT